MSDSTLARLTYEQAQRALEQQEREVHELRARTGTVLSGAALCASFFGPAALGHDAAIVPTVLAGASLAATVIGALYVLYPHDLEFAVDARGMYDDLGPDRDEPDAVRLGVAFSLRDLRDRNGARLHALTRCLAGAILSLVAQIACWAWALALLSR